MPLRVLMALSGHKSMSALQRYLEVTPAQRVAAAAAFA
ncbi:phage integrase family domain protein [Synechococcus sp. RS9915]|nr:phage integrase family domain protein [Synechococcus sp. RS9915]